MRQAFILLAMLLLFATMAGCEVAEEALPEAVSGDGPLAVEDGTAPEGYPPEDSGTMPEEYTSEEGETAPEGSINTAEAATVETPPQYLPIDDFLNSALYGPKTREEKRAYQSSSGWRTGTLFTDKIELGYEIEFGFAGLGGEKILVGGWGFEPDIMYFDKAVGYNGQMVDVEYLGIQDENSEASPYRDNGWNFDNLRGAVYRVTGSPAMENETYMLLNSKLLESVRFYAPDAAAPPPDNIRMIDQLEADTERKMQEHWSLGVYDTRFGLSFMKFEPVERSLLAAVVLETEQGIFRCDFPAELDEDGYDGWRVSDGGEVDKTAIAIVGVFEAEKCLFIVMSWFNEEAESVMVLKYDGTQFFRTDIGYYRYIMGI